MDFITIKSSVLILWNFLWPPLVFVVSGLALLKYVFPTSSQRVFGVFRSYDEVHTQNPLRSLLHSIGASKAYPFVLGVIVILLLHLTNEFIRGFHLFGLSFSIDPSIIAWEHSSFGDRYCLQQLYPEDSSFGSALNFAQRDLGVDLFDGECAFIFLRGRLIIKALLGLLVVSVILFIRKEAHKKRSITRLFAMALLGVGIWWLLLIPALIVTFDDIQHKTDELFKAVRTAAREQEITVPSMTTTNYEVFKSKPDGKWWSIGPPFDSLRQSAHYIYSQSAKSIPMD